MSTSRSGRRRTVIAEVGMVTALTLAAGSAVYAQPRTDVVTLPNGDRITGEVVLLERGRLEFKTDDAGTLYLEWDKLASVVALRLVEVLVEDGTRYLGTLGPAPARSLAVVSPGGTVPVPMAKVTLIRPIGRSFWKKLDGSIDAGFTYTRSSGIAQLNLNWETLYRRPASQARIFASVTQTRQDETADENSADDDRASMELSYRHYPWQRWFVLGAATFETNESLGIRLRSQAATAIGPRLVNTNRTQLLVGAGLVVNDERGVDVEPTQNVEALFAFSLSYFTYDRPKTNVDTSVQYYPSLSNTGRHRLQLDASVKRELWKDFFVAGTVYNTYDNRPPNPAADRNDVGTVLSIGWSY